ncbi:MAG: biotin/lipoyl-binding protein, partial [Cyclobacteriaceae bacterium]|nr:biotin/lipoyl-binding protein [Cyclobacteriaceae bacterium]
MMETKIFPAAITQQTVEVYDSRISVRSRLIYLILLGVLVAAVAALPLIYVDVAVQSRGTFQSALQRNSLMSSVGGRLEKWSLAENQKVKKGDVLAIVRAEVVQLEINGVAERLTLLDDFISDLGSLLNLNLEGQLISLLPLKSKYYQASLLEFQTKIHNQAALLEKLERDFDRAQILYNSKSIAFADYDNT